MSLLTIKSRDGRKNICVLFFKFLPVKGSFSCKRDFSLLNFERGLKKKTMGCLILKLYVVIILY